MRNIILLGITSLLTDISSEMVYPVLPVFLVITLGASPAILGLIEGVAESLASLLKVFSGNFSDRTGKRKPFTILGYTSSGIGKVFIYFATGWGYVLAGRIVDRFGKGVRTAPRDALIAESTLRNKRGAGFGLHRAMDTLGAAIGVGIAYFLLTRFKGDLRNIFLFSLIPAVLAVFFLFLVKEKDAHVFKRAVRPRLRWGGLDKRLKFFIVFSFIFSLGNSSNQFLLLRAKNIGSPLERIILFYLVYNIIFALVAYPASRWSDKIGRKKIMVFGYCAYSVVYLGFACCGSLQALWLLFAVYGIYTGFTEGVEKALVADIAPADLRATAIGLHATVVGAGLLPASLFAGLLWRFLGPAAPFYFGAALGIFAAAGFWIILKDL